MTDAPVSVEDNKRMITQCLRTFEAPEIDINDPDAVKRRIREYFESCEELSLRPGNMGLYAALGLSRQDVNNAITGKSKKLNPETIDMIKKVQRALGQYREQLGATGKINPVTLIFWQKNFDGLQDTTQLEVSRADQERFEPHMTPEEIAEQVRLQIEQDIPIDGDYQEQ